ncbi:hypothetical protein [Candidatus Nitrotoga sp. M5]|uniref:hypothetical protein n=1 Tax=Candidatus Nitrotoga sp. M5 TaxID=2890409 RepID=UPI001EF58B5D|nr:hypothetical protein [Candidatus Nitrotoga sp. M5]CAH1388044.1 hypothetical protein NTGM5_80011 [Candidatus Nitrotoga sp. M5]
MRVCTVLAGYLFIPPFNTFLSTFNTYIIWADFVFCAADLTVIFVVEALRRQRNSSISTPYLLE